MKYLRVSVGVVIQNGKVLICQRPQHVNHGGRWEFPGGKIEKNESVTAALERELYEEVGIQVERSHHFYSTEHQYPSLHVRLECFIVTEFDGTAYAKENQPMMKWVKVESLPQYDFPEANHRVIDNLLWICSGSHNEMSEDVM